MTAPARRERLLLDKGVYPLESLRAAAAALEGRAEMSLNEEGRNWRVELRSRSQTAAGGEFLNETLSHLYRQKVVRFNRDLSGALLARALDRGLLQGTPDPLEQLEPQVRADRQEETRRLMESARRGPPCPD